jgi:hypothetical protein
MTQLDHFLLLQDEQTLPESLFSGDENEDAVLQTSPANVNINRMHDVSTTEVQLLFCD